MELTHLNAQGEANMVDVGGKPETRREAVAEGTVFMKKETLALIKANSLKKGDALASARIAGIMAAKRTFEIIPLCHNIPIESAHVEFSDNGEDELYIRAVLRCSFKTGIEMEALTAVSAAALTVYDMCKSADRGMVIGNIKLVSKTGGKSDFFYER